MHKEATALRIDPHQKQLSTWLRPSRLKTHSISHHAHAMKTTQPMQAYPKIPLRFEYTPMATTVNVVATVKFENALDQPA